MKKRILKFLSLLSFSLYVFVFSIANTMIGFADSGTFVGDSLYHYMPFSAISFIPAGGNPNRTRLNLPMPLFVGSENYGTTYSFDTQYQIGEDVYTATYFEFNDYYYGRGACLRTIQFGVEYGGIGGFSLLCDSFVLYVEEEGYEDSYLNHDIIIYESYVGSEDVCPFVPSLSGTVFNIDTFEFIPFNFQYSDVPVESINFGAYIEYFINQLSNLVGGYQAYYLNDFKISFALNPYTYSQIGFELPSLVDSLSDTYYNERFLEMLDNDADLDIGGIILKNVNKILHIEVFPNFRFLDLLAIALGIPIAMWLLKLWLGG